jgi:hypothetical protein
VTAITNANYSGADVVAGHTYVSNSDTDKVGPALSRGFVYINIASRSRGATASAGVYQDGVYQSKPRKSRSRPANHSSLLALTGITRAMASAAAPDPCTI